MIDPKDGSLKSAKNLLHFDNAPIAPAPQPLKPSTDSQTLGLHGTPLLAATDSDEYEVEKILTRRGENDHLQYLIKWKGYPMDDCSWEPKSNLKNAKRVLAAFDNKHETEQRRRLL